jgi:hypothetical protein
MTKLKPCPFCGGEADIGGDPHSDRWVFCIKCYASVFDTYLDGAIQSWNTRVVNPEPLREFIWRLFLWVVKRRTK